MVNNHIMVYMRSFTIGVISFIPWGHDGCGEWEVSDAGKKGGTIEDPAREGENGGARMPGDSAEEREEGP